MKIEEQIAKTYLEHLGYHDIVFEPDGNIPPDFLLNGDIAVEVRRLNQHFQSEGKMGALEELEYRLIPKIISILNEYKHIPTPHSVFVFIDFERPLKATQILFNKVRNSLNTYLTDFGQSRTLTVTDNLTLEMCPVEGHLSSPLVFGGYNDSNSGGFVAANIHAHLPMVIAEKECKVIQHIKKYPIWWLILIDTIGYGLDQNDLQQFNENPPYETIFDKIILVSPNNPTHGSEIQTEKLSYET